MSDNAKSMILGAVSRSASSRTSKPKLLSLVQLLCASLLHLGISRAAPLFSTLEDEPKSAEDPQKWILLGTAIALVLLGGAFAGLTIA